jgi:pyruvate dehydrogenase E1 component
VGQRYDPEDIGSLMSYREALDGQILEEGISEAGALASWTAAATSYSVHGLAMLPFYIYYSMFGFQRVGDQIWAAADQRARGFLLGATSGRTTLGGEGLQHQDGSSHLHAAAIPNCKAYDPAFAGELAMIVQQGMQDMMVDQKDVFYYITMMNENYAQPNLDMASHAAVLKGGYRFATYGKGEPSITLAGSGAILGEVIKAAQTLAGVGICTEVLSITSWRELSRNPAYTAELFSGNTPIVAASDYVRAVPESIRAWLPKERSYTTLGTDGFGRSDTRSVLREFFGVDAKAIATAAKASILK